MQSVILNSGMCWRNEATNRSYRTVASGGDDRTFSYRGPRNQLPIEWGHLNNHDQAARVAVEWNFLYPRGVGTMNELRDLALDVAQSHLGRYYSWGGDDPSGFDCSGLVVEVLKSCGKIPRKADFTARGLYDWACRNGGAVGIPTEPGCLVFWGATSSPNSIFHVEIAWGIFDGTWVSMGASGGGSKTKTREDAIRDNAFIKIRPMYGRNSHIFFADPFL